MSIHKATLFVTIALILYSSKSDGGVLIGDAGLSQSTIDGFNLNPANLGFSSLNYLDFKLLIYSEDTLAIQYRGLDPIVKKQKGSFINTKLSAFQSGTPVSATLSHPEYKLAYTFVFVPPVAIGSSLTLRNIPLVALESQNYVDIKVKNLKLNGYLAGKIGKRFGKSFSIGSSIRYLSLAAEADVIESASQISFLSLDQEIAIGNISMGMRYDFSSSFSLGLVFDLFSMGFTDIKTDLVPSPSGETNYELQNPTDSFAVGIEYRNKSRSLWLDSYYKRAKEEETVSLASGTLKPKDNYTTISFRAGLQEKFSRRLSLLSGYRYEPASVGSGGSGPDSKAGFGTFEMIQLVAFGSDLTPFHQLSVGGQVRLGRVRVKGKKGKKAKGKSFYSFIISSGLVYKEASLGVDDEGDQPGAYYQKSFSVPLDITYRF
ncbi:hypothetical protein [Pseudobacteriovorax antillogorgiicola]|nr:hypothetical protein [Pseudobacteriovorax antillogorgiicola]